MASRALGGTAIIKVDGTQYMLRGNWKVAPNSMQNTGVAGGDGPHGYLQKWMVPSIEGDVSDYGGFSIQGLQNITNSTITLELNNGKTYVLVSAWYAGDGSLDAVQAQTTVKFEGMSCSELLATS